MSLEGPLRLAQMDRSRLERTPPLLDALLGGELHAVVVRGVLTAEEAASIVRALEARPDARERLHPDSGIELVGKPLQWSPADRSPYLDAADHVREACATLFPEIPLLLRAREALSAAAGRPLKIAADGGREYAPMTLRRIPPGSFVGPHFELGQLGFPAYAGLAGRIDRTTLFSFYVVLAAPDEGGELAAYPLRWGEPDASRVIDRDDEPSALLGRYEPTLIAPRPGDMLLFDSGRHAHAVRRVGGARARWTAGGLLAFDVSRETVLAWA